MAETGDDWNELAQIALAQLGDLSAFDRLVRRYRPGVALIARQILGVAEAAEDAVQDAFVSAYKALPQLRDQESFAAWLGAIVRHRCRRALAGEKRRPLPLDRLIVSHAPSIVAELELTHRREAVRCAIGRLPEDLRPSVELYYLDDWPVRLIAEFLGLAPTTVKWRLHTARERLRESLAPHLSDSNKEKSWN